MDDVTLLAWIERGQNIAALLVALGVAGEFVGGFMATPIRKRLDAVTTAEIARLNKEAGDARKDAGNAVERAGMADERAANAEKEAARLNREAEQERLARLQLEEKYAPRRLSPEQRKNLKEFLSKFPPEEITVQVFIGTPDGIPFSMDLIEAVNSGGWTATHTGQATMGGNLRGVSILVKDVTKAPQKAMVIQKALKHIGIEAPAVNDPSGGRMRSLSLLPPSYRRLLC